MEEDNKKAAKAFVDKYFPLKQQPNSKFPDVLNDLFPPTSQPESSKRQEYEGQSSNAAAGKSGKTQSTPQKSSTSAVLYCEVSEPCSMSSSVDYGCRDNYYPNPPPNRQPGSYDKKDKKDGYYYPDPEHSRGEWWQGSLYY